MHCHNNVHNLSQHVAARAVTTTTIPFDQSTANGSAYTDPWKLLALFSTALFASMTPTVPDNVQCEAAATKGSHSSSHKSHNHPPHIPLIDNESNTTLKTTAAHAYCIASYNANDPMEDRVAVGLLTPPSSPPSRNTSQGDTFALFDGHGGWQVSHYVQAHLIPNTVTELKSVLMTHASESDPLNQVSMSKAITRAFERTDRDLLSQVRQSFDLGFGQVAKVGSCALLVHVRTHDLFVANAGDCRVVMGSRPSPRCNLSEDEAIALPLEASSFVTTPLSTDHNARLPAEQRRLALEHPGEEDIIKCKSPTACYVKGRLQPTRSFGDFYLKHSELNGPPYVKGDRSRGRHVPAPYTPPYITATPEMTHQVLTVGEEVFLIMGTDGVWDFLENEEAVNIVQGAIEAGTPQLASQMVLEQVLTRAATLSQMSLDCFLTLPAGRSRRNRHDDTTVMVVYLNGPPSTTTPSTLVA